MLPSTPYLLLRPANVVAVAGSFTTLDPVNRGTSQTLSNGNLTVTGNGTDGIAQSAVGHASGKYYCEATCGTVVNSILGATPTGYTLSSNFLGNANSVGAVGTGYLGSGLTGTTTAPALVAGHVFGIAIDVDNRAIWIKDVTAAGNWNANGTANPATNTNGCIFAGAVGSGTIFAAVDCSGNGDSLTMNFGATAYTGTPPAGFGNW